MTSSRSAGSSASPARGARQRRGHALLARLAQHRRDPRVRVLDVVDGVLGRLLRASVEVEVDRRVGRAREHEEARGVDADLVDQLVERDEVAAALGHRGALAALDDVDELQQRHLEPVGVGAARRRAIAFSRTDVAVVVGAEHVDEPVEAALELVPVVGDVGGEVGRLAVGAHERAVLLVARERRRAQPQRALAAGRRGRRRSAARAPRSQALGSPS